jgi:hypothetical protein
VNDESLPETIARLQARVQALEAALVRRSRELRLIQEHACGRDLVLIARITEGLPVARGTYEPALWAETTELSQADVEHVLRDLWGPPPGAEEPDGR